MKRCGKVGEDFELLKAFYGIQKVNLKIVKTKYGTGSYSSATKTVKISSRRRTCRNLFVLLHEIKHAIQDKDGTLKFYSSSFKDRWRLEREAYSFALNEYRRLYQLRFGNYPWKLVEVLKWVKPKYEKEWKKLN